MKLPGIEHKWNVSPLAKRDIYAPQKVANAQAGVANAWAGASNATASAANSEANASRKMGQAYEQLGGYVTDVSMEIQQAKENEAVSGQYANAQTSLQNTRAFLNRPSIPIDQIPDGVDYKDTETVVGQGGTVQETKRTSIPTSEIASQIFQQRMNELHKVGKENLSSRGYEAFNKQFAPQELAYRGQLFNQSAKAEYQAMQKSTLDQARSLFLSGDDQAGKEIIASSVVLDEREKVNAVVDLNIESAKHRINTVMKTENPDTMRGYADLLVSDQYEGFLNPMERERYAKQLVTRANSLQADEIATAQKQREKYASDLEIDISNGGGDLQAIDKAFDSDIISGAKRTQLTKAWYTQQGKIRQNAVDMNGVVERRMSGDYFDPVKDSKQYNNWFDSLKLNPAKPEDMAQIIKYANMDRMLPKATNSYIRSRSVSDNPQVIEQLVDFTDRLSNYAPEAYSQLSDKDRATVQMYSDLRASGTSIDANAIKTVKTAMYLDDGVRETRKSNLKADFKATPVTERVNDFIDENYDTYWLSSQPAMSEELKQGYSHLYSTYYTATGSAETAKKLTEQNLAQVYGVTEVAGERRMMKYSPESQFPEDQQEWLQGDFANVASGEGIHPDQHTFGSDEITFRETPRTYPIVNRATGFAVYKVENGQRFQLRWNPTARFRMYKKEQHQWAQAERLAKSQAKIDRKQAIQEDAKRTVNEALKRQPTKGGYGGVVVDINETPDKEGPHF